MIFYSFSSRNKKTQVFSLLWEVLLAWARALRNPTVHPRPVDDLSTTIDDHQLPRASTKCPPTGLAQTGKNHKEKLHILVSDFWPVGLRFLSLAAQSCHEAPPRTPTTCRRPVNDHQRPSTTTSCPELPRSAPPQDWPKQAKVIRRNCIF